MTHVAIILIETRVGKAWYVAEEIKKVEYVKHAYSVTGPYDVVAFIEHEESVIPVLRSIVEKIHSIDGVERTLTMIAVH